MHLTPAQLTVLRGAIDADPALAALPNTPDDNNRIVAAFKELASPDFWVVRTSVSESEYTTQPGPDGTNWSWQAYMARNQGERDGWGRLFATGAVNPSRANVRAAFDNIFNGIGIAADQRTHLTAVSRRKANRAEKLYATGTGTTAAPATLTVEGALDREDVERARNL